MKIFITVIISFVIAIAGFVTNAQQPGKCIKTAGYNKQADDVDQLLMLVFKSNYKQNAMNRSRGMGRGKQKYSAKMMGKGAGKGRSCPMQSSGKYGKRGKCDESMRSGKYKRMRRGFGRKAGKYMLKSRLMEKYPKEMKEIIAQKKSNDNAMKDVLAKFKTLVDKTQTEMQAEREQFKKMLDEYKKSKDPKLAEQIKAKMSTYYDRRLECMKKRIDQDSARLKEARANKDKTISEKLEKMIK